MGKLTGYMVQYRNVDNNGTLLNVTVNNASRTSVALEGLLPASNYSIQVILILVDRLQKQSDELFVATKGKCCISLERRCVRFVPSV